ncbi:beta-N-acetylhexosaminidase [Alteromonas sp. H39]|uniref:beta-N-acetylhexosaminidase n=1 Tax=Alteromonas sp. H39 TaxID=3389876 RepID=UPI0039E05E39
MGPLMLDCRDALLLPEEREKLAHPNAGGVILFSRNYHDKQQLRELVRSIREAAGKPVLIAVDHEGGRVQRFREGFTRLPAMGEIQSMTSSPEEAAAIARCCGVITASELKAVDIDFSFAPVLDINGISRVIGDRAFADNAKDVITLASAFIAGLHDCNMPAVGKHFPGHGSVAPDSHVDLPVDDRSLYDIERTDMVVFQKLVTQGKLDGIMPAHVIYSEVDNAPAGFSPVWLQQILKQQVGFKGAIFSDDLSMHGASVAGDYVSRARQALRAGCDMVLACNNVAGAESILDNLAFAEQASSALTAFSGRTLPDSAPAHYQQACRSLAVYG